MVKGFRMGSKYYEKKEKKLIASGYSLKTHKWCPYCKDFHSKKAFYKNRAQKDGFQIECKVVSFMRANKKDMTFSEVLRNYYSFEKKLFTSY